MPSDELLAARLALAEADAAAALTRRKARATSTPLLIAGVIGTAASLIQWATGDMYTTELLIGPVTIAVLAGLSAVERRRWRRTGLSGVADYSLAALVLLAVGLLVLPVAFFGLAGPFLGLAIVLVVFGIRDRRQRLVIWTALLATLGTAENYYAFTNRLAYTSSNESLHFAILVAVGVLFLVAGLLERQHGN